MQNAHAEETASKSGLTVLSFNILYDHKKWGSQFAWPKRMPWFASLLKAHPSDLMGFQEVTAGQLADIQNILGPGFKAVDPSAALDKIADAQKDAPPVEGVPKAGDPNYPRIMNPIFYRTDRIEVTKEGVLPLPGNRHVSWIAFRDKTTGKNGYYFNLHLIVSKPELQEQSLQILTKYWADNIDPATPIIVSGDWNVGKETLLNRWGLKDAGFSHARLMVSGEPTQSPIGTKVDRRTFEISKAEVDNIFLKNISKSLIYKILTDKFEERYPSDHLPVTAMVEF